MTLPRTPKGPITTKWKELRNVLECMKLLWRDNWNKGICKEAQKCRLSKIPSKTKTQIILLSRKNKRQKTTLLTFTLCQRGLRGIEITKIIKMMINLSILMNKRISLTILEREEEKLEQKAKNRMKETYKSMQNLT